MTDYKFTKKERSVLEQYKIHLQRAKDGYVRGLYSTDLDVLSPLYAKFGMHLENKHCAACVLGMMQFLANKYFNDETV